MGGVLENVTKRYVGGWVGGAERYVGDYFTTVRFDKFFGSVLKVNKCY